MPTEPLPVEQILRLLRESPQRIADLTRQAAPAVLLAAPAPGEWSANEVLAHLRASADVWGNVIRELLAGEKPTIRIVSPGAWLRRTNYRELAFAPSFDAFRAQRTDLLALLEPLPSEAWQQHAIVIRSGTPREQSVRSIAQLLAEHEHGHLRQIAEAIGAVLPGPDEPA